MNLPSELSYTYVDTNSKLNDLVSRLAGAKRIALDTEADSLHHFYEKVCLIQLTLKKKNYIIDPLSGIDLTGFFKILSGKPLILHGADYDLRMLLGGFGFRPRGEVYDTMLAAQLLGYKQFGLSSLIERFFGIKTSKQPRRADWSRRPVSPRLLEYACGDTFYLEELAKLLESKLRALGRCEWRRQSCERLVKTTARRKQRKDPNAWRIKGSRKLRPRELALLYHLWHWRQEQAKRTDRPPFKVMTNALMLELCVWSAVQKKIDLSKGPKLPRNCVKARLKSLQKAIEAALDTPEAYLPGQLRRSDINDTAPNCKITADALRKECETLARQLAIPPQILAPRATLTAIARKRLNTSSKLIQSGLVMPWQVETLLPAIKRVFKD